MLYVRYIVSGFVHQEVLLSCSILCMSLLLPLSYCIVVLYFVDVLTILLTNTPSIRKTASFAKVGRFAFIIPEVGWVLGMGQVIEN